MGLADTVYGCLVVYIHRLSEWPSGYIEEKTIWEFVFPMRVLVSAIKRQKYFTIWWMSVL